MKKKQLLKYVIYLISIFVSLLLSLFYCDTKETMYVVDPVSFSDYKSSIISYDPTRTIITTTKIDEVDDKEQNGIYGTFVGSDLYTHQSIKGPMSGELIIISGSSTNMISPSSSSLTFPSYYEGDIDNYFFSNTESNFVTASLEWSNSSCDLDMIIWNYSTEGQKITVSYTNNAIYLACTNSISLGETSSHIGIYKSNFLISVVPKVIDSSSVTSTCTYNLNVAGQ